MPMSIEEAHEWEEYLMTEFKRKYHTDKIPYFGSTWDAIDWLEEKVYGENE